MIFATLNYLAIRLRMRFIRHEAKRNLTNSPADVCCRNKADGVGKEAVGAGYNDFIRSDSIPFRETETIKTVFSVYSQRRKSEHDALLRYQNAAVLRCWSLLKRSRRWGYRGAFHKSCPKKATQSYPQNSCNPFAFYTHPNTIANRAHKNSGIL